MTAAPAPPPTATPSGEVKMTSALPKEDHYNGLTVIAQEALEDPRRHHVAVVVLDCARITTDTDTGEAVPTLRIRRAEVVRAPEDRARLTRLAERALEVRTGRAVLPLGLEDDLTVLFGDEAEDVDDDGASRTQADDDTDGGL